VTERYLGHSAKTTTDKHYVTLGEGQMLELMRVQVVRALNRILRSARATMRAKKHEKSTGGNLVFLDEMRRLS
jgi:hypothetical protein